MNQFYVGQRVRATCPPGIYLTGLVPLGTAGTVISDLIPDDGVMVDHYMVKWDDGRTTTRNALCIEPIEDDDPRSLTTWDEVTRAIGWKPTREQTLAHYQDMEAQARISHSTPQWGDRDLLQRITEEVMEAGK